MNPSSEEIRQRAAEFAFGKPVIENSLRSIVAECILADALGSAWIWCSANWSGWDFEHADGRRLEVKQSAARQTWAQTGKKASPRFDIAARKGYYAGEEWFADEGRHASIYVFCWHPIEDDSADHFDCTQWEFFVVDETALPEQKTISLSRLNTIGNFVGIKNVFSAVEAILEE